MPDKIKNYQLGNGGTHLQTQHLGGGGNLTELLFYEKATSKQN